MDKTSQATRIFHAIKDSGDRGIENWKLAHIALNYTMRISDLRKDGHDIVAIRQYDRNGKALSTYRYKLYDDKMELRRPSMLARLKGGLHI